MDSEAHMEIDKYEPGIFCWVDYTAAAGTQSAKDFYTALFGWESNDLELPGGGVYTGFKLKGRDVAALSEQQPEEKALGIPSHWNSYVNVDDVDQIAKAAQAAGGKVLAEPFDVLDVGRMTVISDPTGAVVSGWQPLKHIGAGIVNEPNSVVWNELLTPDPAAAGPFYSEVFGWDRDEVPMQEIIYTVFRSNSKPVGGMMKPPDEGGETPPNWLVYFEVADCDATVEKLKELGGQVYWGPSDIPTVGRIATVADSQGGFFAVMTSEPPAS
jgi:uncharacterized protein